MESNLRHTPEPWRVGTPPPNGEYTIGDKFGQMVAITTTGYDTGLSAEANAKRIVDCVNACDGMDDPLTELTRLRGEVERLTLQNVELVEASDAEFKRYMEAKARAETAEAQLADMEAQKNAFYVQATMTQSQLAELQARKPLTLNKIGEIVAEIEDENGSYISFDDATMLSQAIHSALPPDQGELIMELRKYVKHDKDCELVNDSLGWAPCTCGLEQAIAKSKEQGYGV